MLNFTNLQLVPLSDELTESVEQEGLAINEAIHELQTIRKELDGQVELGDVDDLRKNYRVVLLSEQELREKISSFVVKARADIQAAAAHQEMWARELGDSIAERLAKIGFANGRLDIAIQHPDVIGAKTLSETIKQGWRQLKQVEANNNAALIDLRNQLKLMQKTALADLQRATSHSRGWDDQARMLGVGDTIESGSVSIMC